LEKIFQLFYKIFDVLLCIVLNEQGDIVEGAKVPDLDQNICLQIYTNMLRLNVSKSNRRAP
jgi:hypothetical protein